MLQEELKSAKESLEQLQNILQQEKGQAATSTQTEVEYESRGTSMQQQDQGIQAVNNNSSRTASGLRQENKKLTRDKLTISEQLKQHINLNIFFPPNDLCTDNAIMVGWTGIERLQKNYIDPLNFAPRPKWELESY